MDKIKIKLFLILKKTKDLKHKNIKLFTILLLIILIIVYPIIKIALSSLIFKLSAALLEPITDKRITNSIAAAGESLILIMSCVVCVSLMFFVLISIMISAGKFVVGG